LNPEISVILPVYNAATYLREALDSVLQQTYADFELLVYDDGSVDDSRQILDSYTDPRIIRHYSDENQGLIKVLNTSLSHARGKYLARMDADDICLPDRFEKQIAFLNQHSEYGICGTQLKLIHNGQEIKRPCDDNALRWWFFKGSPLAHPSVMIRASVIHQNQLRFDETAYVAEDFDLWWRLAFYCKMYNLDEALLLYRIHPDQESSAKASIQAQSHAISLKKLMQFIGLNDRALTTEFIEHLLSKELPSDYSNISKSLLFFDSLLKAENACRFFGKQSIEEERLHQIVYQLQTIKKFNILLLKLFSNNGFIKLLQAAKIKPSLFIFKCLLQWKTR